MCQRERGCDVSEGKGMSCVRGKGHVMCQRKGRDGVLEGKVMMVFQRERG